MKLIPSCLTIMNDNPNPVVFAVQSAVLELLESIDHVLQNDNPERQEESRQEAQKTVLMLIAAIVLANRQYEPFEMALSFNSCRLARLAWRRNSLS